MGGTPPDLNKGLSEIEATLKDSPTLEKLQEAANRLQALARDYERTQGHAPLAADAGSTLQSRLADKLLETRGRILAKLAAGAHTAEEWRTAQRHADTWLALYPDAPAFREQVLQLWTRHGERQVADGAWSEAVRTLRRIDDEFAQSPAADGLRKALRARAEELAKEARGLPDDQAVRKLQEAAALWPSLPELRDDLARRKKQWHVLLVAVRQLPESLSPATATTDSEKRCLDLLFENLVRPRASASLGSYYEPELARSLPMASGLQRRFDLGRRAYWSDGERVTSADVRHTAQLLSQSGAATAWRDLYEVPRFEGDPFRLTFTQRQGVWDPLEPLSFKVLPQQVKGKPLTRADEPEFAKAPVGSGPYVYAGRKPEGQRVYAVVKANPYFERDLAIREVRLFAWSDPAKDLGQPTPHLVLDLGAKQVESVRKAGFSDIRSLANRRVYFLAVNHRLPALANLDLRRALAHGIDRAKLLADHFQGSGPVAKRSHPLNGPFPSGSWASCPPPRVPEDALQPELARSFAKKAAKDLGTLRLSLKFPADAPGVKEACAALAEQLAKVFADVGATLELKLEPLDAPRLGAALRDHQFELAYQHWDYSNDHYWLWPLFDPHPDALRPGGSNYLGYDGDAKLQSLFRAALSQRHFPAVRDLHHALHAHLYERMPLIPLWQLPTHVAVHPSLQTGDLDPMSIFSNIAEWKLAN